MNKKDLVLIVVMSLATIGNYVYANRAKFVDFNECSLNTDASGKIVSKTCSPSNYEKVKADLKNVKSGSKVSITIGV